MSDKSKGQVDIVVGMFLVLIVFIMVLFGFKTTQMMVVSAYVEDALAASNLASALIDLETYGKSHEIIIKEPESAFVLFREALCHNLRLDDSLQSTNGESVITDLWIPEYRVYNVSEDKVMVYIIDGNGIIQDQYNGKKGEIVTPDGVCVNSTTVYSKVFFEISGIGDQNIRAKKEKSIDIVRCEDE